MKHLLLYMMLCANLLMLTGCHQEESDLFATALITVEPADANCSIMQVQAQAQLTNVNTRQVTTTADFDGATLRVELLRGAYQVNIEGVATCKNVSGQTQLRQFRAQTDYVELVAPGTNTATLQIIFLD